MTDETIIYLPPFPTPVKPEYGSPCNGCGWCCHEEVCKIGMHFFDISESEAPCPAILYIDGRVRCGIVVGEEALGLEPKVKEALGVGRGCDASDPWRHESAQSAK